MPLYVYQCPECEHQFERLARVSDPLPQCPNTVPIDDGDTSRDVKCSGQGVKIPAKGGSFHLKGSGWASDGYS